MPMEDLLAQVAEEHRILQSKYDEALLKMNTLRFQSGALQPPELDIRSFQDREAASTQRHMLCEFLHRAPPASDRPAVACRSYAVNERQSLSNLEMKFMPSRNSCGLRLSGGLGPSGMLRNSGNRNSVQPLKMSYRKSTSGEARSASVKSVSEKNYLDVGGSRSTRSFDFERDSHRQTVASLLRHPALEFVLIFVVVSNIVVLWLETDRRAQELPRAIWSQVLNYVFLIVYSLEFGLRVYAYRIQVFDDRWNRLDLTVITVDIASLLLEAIVGDFLLGGINASIFRLLRVFRLLRLFKVLRFVIELQLLVHGFFGAMKAQLFAGFMLEIVVLLWSFLFVEVVHPHVIEMSDSGFFEECVRCTKAYSSMFEAHMTIWQQVIAGDSWGNVTLDVVSKHPETSIIFIGCLMTIQFAMLNLIFTVIVDAAARAREEDDQQKLVEKEMSFQKLKEKLLEICKRLDKDGTGELSLQELIDGYAENPLFADTMATLDITTEDLSTVFMIMDEDRSGAVSYIEFVNKLYKLKEQDQNTLLMFIKGYVCDLRYHVQEVMANIMSDMRIQLVENTSRMQTMMGHIETSSSHIESLLTRGDDENNRAPQQKICPATNLTENDKKDIASLLEQAPLLASNQQPTLDSWSRDSISDALSKVFANFDLVRKDLDANFDCLQARVQDIERVSSVISDKLSKLCTRGSIRASVDPMSFAVIPEKAEKWRVLEVPVRTCV